MRARLLLAIALLACVLPVHAWAAQRYDWRLRFRTLATARFDIYYHQGEDSLARRLAAIAEDVATGLQPEYGRPSGRVGIILVDQNDLSNGWATPLPYNLIEITAAAPPGVSIIGNTDDWLRMVFTHEYTHILHLDRSLGLFGGLRKVFGRAPLLFPNLFLPTWQIEGIATHEEGGQTMRGRVHAGEIQSIVHRAAETGRFASLDRASHPLIRWPGGSTPYIYGGLFHEYLADRFGAASLARLRDETARRPPYLGSFAFKAVFGRSLGQLWNDFEAHTRGAATPLEPTTRSRLTDHGFSVTAPRYTADGRLFYSVAGPHGFPSLMEHVPGRRPRVVTTRYLGNTLGAGNGVLVFDQLEYVRNVGLQSDLYAVDPAAGRPRRLTEGARAADPDLSPDGLTIVCTVQSADRRAIATMPFRAAGGPSTPVVLVSEPHTEFYSPRWSPDGRTIAAERRRSGVAHEIVLIDVATKRVRHLIASVDGRNIGPAWLDEDTVLYASDREGRPFSIYALDINGGLLRRLLGTGAGAHSPALSPDGRTLLFVAYSADGYDLYSIPLADAQWQDIAVVASDPGGGPWPAPPPADVPADDGPYRPLPSLKPRFWTPVIENDSDEWIVGAASGGIDPLGRHAYGASVAWSFTRARPDWVAAYAYDRWAPTLFVQALHDTDPFRDGDFRTTELDAGALLPVRRVRWTSSFLGAFHASRDERRCETCAPDLAGAFSRRALRFGWALDTARRYGYSISDVDGGTIAVSSEIDRAALGASGDATSLSADFRWFARAFPRHAVVAARVAGAGAWGDPDSRRIFSAAGAGPQGGGFRFGLDAIGLLRGFDETDVFGWRAAVLNVDYRIPLARVERGFGTVPVFLRTIHGSLFFDTGDAWLRRFDTSRLRRSYGLELSADTLIGYGLPMTFTGGAAWRDDPFGESEGWSFFARIGRAF